MTAPRTRIAATRRGASAYIGYAESTPAAPLRPVSAAQVKDIGLVKPPTREQVEAARRTVASYARDVDDARELLDELGLLP